MKLQITDGCTGHGRCYTLAPQLVEDDELGHGVVKHDGLVPEGDEDAARTISRVCPERAIDLIS